MESRNSLDIDNLRLAIGVLTKDVDERNPCRGEFYIQTDIPDAKNETVHVSGSHIKNKISKKSTTIKQKKTISIRIPEAYRLFFNKKGTIPKGTKFIVSYVDGNINNSKIVSIYSKELNNKYLYTYYEMHKKLKQLQLYCRILDARTRELGAIHAITYKEVGLNAIGRENEINIQSWGDSSTINPSQWSAEPTPSLEGCANEPGDPEDSGNYVEEEDKE